MSKIDDVKARLQKRQAANKEASRRNMQDFSDHPLLFIALIVSGFMSSMAGVAIGLGLHVVNGDVVVNLDIPHIFFAVVYGALFPIFYEFALGNWLHKLLHREVNNNYQFFASLAMVALTFLGTAITMFVASDILVTTLGFFDSFDQIPVEVQRWIAFSLPGMFLLNIAAGEVYRQFSSVAILRREAAMELREKQVESDTEFELTQMDIKKNISIRAAQEYSQRAGGEVDGIARQQGKDKWNQDKQRMGGAYAASTDAPPDLQNQQPNLRQDNRGPADPNE